MTTGKPLPPDFVWDPANVHPREARLGAHMLTRRTPDDLRQMPTRMRMRVVGKTTRVDLEQDPDAT